MIRYRTEIERFGMILGCRLTLGRHEKRGFVPQREILPAKRKTNPAVTRSF